MIPASDQQCDDRQAIEENRLADLATKIVQAIPHDQASKLHADEAHKRGAPPATQKTALDVTAVGGSVTVSIAGEIAFLTPEAAGQTGDRLLARAHEAGRQATQSRRSPFPGEHVVADLPPSS